MWISGELNPFMQRMFHSYSTPEGALALKLIWTNAHSCRCNVRPCPKWNTSCALAVLRTYNGHRVRVSVKSTRLKGVLFLILALRRVLASAVVSRYLPSIRTSAVPLWGELHIRRLPDSQRGITSRKCGLRGRPRGFRVPLGTGLAELNKRRNLCENIWFMGIFQVISRK